MTAGKEPWPTPLAERLAGQGPMPFRDYMAEALYAPKHGFHTRRDQHRRAKGSATQDTVYVAGLARQLARLFIAFSEEHQPRLIEQGAGSVKLLRFLLTALPEEILSELELVIVEPRLARRTRLVAVIQEFGVDGKVVGSASNVAPGACFVVANQLLSSFPVHWLEAAETGWQEVAVSFEADRWAWQETLEAPPDRVEAFLDNALELPAGHRYEANLQMAGWIGDVASVLDPGLVVGLDRLRPAASPPEGTLEARLAGEPVGPYTAPGQMELSAAVDDQRLIQLAGEHGLGDQPPPAGLAEACKPHLEPVVLTAGGIGPVLSQ